MSQNLKSKVEEILKKQLLEVQRKDRQWLLPHNLAHIGWRDEGHDLTTCWVDLEDKYVLNVTTSTHKKKITKFFFSFWVIKNNR